MADEVVAADRPPDQRLVHSLRQAIAGELVECAGERPLARDRTGKLPPTQPPQHRIDPQPIDQHARGRQVEHGLGRVRPSQREAVLRRTSGQTVDHLHERLDTRHLEHDDEPTVAFLERAGRLLQHREKPALNVAPRLS